MINKETICLKCKSKDIIKRGILKTDNKGNRQRYGCKECNHRFVEDEPFRRMRNQNKMITLCIDLYYSGMSFRKVKEHLEKFYPSVVGASTIYRWILKYIPMMDNFTDKQKIKAGWQLQGDEVEYKRRASAKQKGIRNEYFIDIIDIESRYIVSSQYAKDRKTYVLNKVYGRAKRKVGNQVKMISTDGLMSYPRVIRKTFNLKKQATKNPQIIHQIIKSDSGKFNYKIERFHNTLRARTKTMRGFHGCISSAQTLMKGFEIYYNWIRQHQSLSGLTPSDVAVPNIQLQNKNRWIEIIERGIENDKRFYNWKNKVCSIKNY